MITILRYPVLAAFLLSLSPCSGDELTDLRDSYQKALQRAAEPVRATYIEELKKLMDRQTRAGDLDGAIATRAEIQGLTSPAPATSAAPVAPAPMPPTTAPTGGDAGAIDPILHLGDRLPRQELNEIEKRFVERLWVDVLREHHTIYFRNDGTATRVIDSRTGKKQDFKWEMREDGLVVCGDRSFVFANADAGKWFVPNGNTVDLTNLKPVPGGKDPNGE